MAIFVTSSMPGLTKEIYEQMGKDMNWEANPPAGLLCHIAATEGNGMRIATVWSGEQDFNNFVSGKLAPAFQKYNVPKPQPQILQIHNVNTFPGLEKYKIASAQTR